MNKKPDIEIGYRASAFVEQTAKKLGISIQATVRIIGVGKNNYYRWRSGEAPGAYALQALAMAGADVDYILTGRKTNKEENND